jgi:tetrahydromethanopterin S-methyltransferase subunit G
MVCFLGYSLDRPAVMPEPSLELLQAMMQRMLDMLAEHSAEFREVRLRLSAIERHIAGLRRDDALAMEAAIDVREVVDRLGERIERQLGLLEA